MLGNHSRIPFGSDQEHGYTWGSITENRLNNFGMTFPFGKFTIAMIRRLPATPNGLVTGITVSLLAGFSPPVYIAVLICCCTMVIVHAAARWVHDSIINLHRIQYF